MVYAIIRIILELSHLFNQDTDQISKIGPLTPLCLQKCMFVVNDIVIDRDTAEKSCSSICQIEVDIY